LHLSSEKPVSNLALQCNLHRYTEVGTARGLAAVLAASAAGGGGGGSSSGSGSGGGGGDTENVFPVECLFRLLTSHAVAPALADEHNWRVVRFARLLDEAPALWPEVLRRTLATVAATAGLYSFNPVEP
jgi:hypothetical protein